ncbi:MAG: peptidylprolyl isomerase [Ignavibacteriae bacterium]|nr:peptidylprolyl isomerase [Ignavibacteriota bacterium]
MKTAAFLLILASRFLVSAQELPANVLRPLLTAQDLRDAKMISKFLMDKSASVRAKAAFACGSIQDTSAIPQLQTLLAEKYADVRLAAAFALGQLNYVIDSVQRRSVSLSLTKQLSLERENRVNLRILEALGKVGDERSLSILVAAAESFRSSTAKSEAALAIGRYAYRGIKSKVATEFVADLLAPSFRGEHWKAAYALMRISDASLFTRHEDQIMQAASHASADVRMFIATALGKIVAMPKAANALLSLALSDRDWRVRVNAIKALVLVDSRLHPRFLPPMIRMTADSNLHVSLTAIATLGDMNLGTSAFSAECQKAYVEVMTASQFSERQRREAAIALGKLRHAEAYEILQTKFHQSNLTKESFAAAIAFTPTRDAIDKLIELARDTDPSTARAALESLQQCAKAAGSDSGVVEPAREAFRAALRSPDFTVVITAATALADSAFLDDAGIAALISTLRSLKSPKDNETIIAVMQAMVEAKRTEFVAPLESCLNDSDALIAEEAAESIHTLTGKSPSYVAHAAHKPSHTNFDWALMEEVRRNPFVNVRTNKGAFKIRLLVDEAPFTCISFASLIQQKFFDGKLFHRVVPNFVIQGGDPRGDGWGGPDYYIRSEFGSEHYTRGTVGVASSGKDTEGCQWFVTHCSTPHLDGRYTIFGKVVSGMEIVDLIQIGDRIEAMSF